MKFPIAIARQAAALAALLALCAPARAGDDDRYRGHAPLVLNGRLATGDFTGGVGTLQFQDDDCCYGGAVIVIGGRASTGAMSAASAFARAAAFAGSHSGMSHGHR